MHGCIPHQRDQDNGPTKQKLSASPPLNGNVKLFIKKKLEDKKSRRKRPYGISFLSALKQRIVKMMYLVLAIVLTVW
jgi:hypothetical protein